MYVKRIQLINYGPIEQLHIELPFDGDTPRPIILVGENGSGKSILLSHIVNGLMWAKSIAYPDSPEVETNKVYKLRTSSYIGPRLEFCFGRVDFEQDFFVNEITSRLNKQDYSGNPAGLTGASERLWGKVQAADNDYYDSNFTPSSIAKITDVLTTHCVLYFPFNRFEEPAWLNEDNLNAEAQYMELKHIARQTDRRIVSHSPLYSNQNWLFELAFDRAAFELQTRRLNFPMTDGGATVPLPVFSGYSGAATKDL